MLYWSWNRIEAHKCNDIWDDEVTESWYLTYTERVTRWSTVINNACATLISKLRRNRKFISIKSNRMKKNKIFAYIQMNSSEIRMQRYSKRKARATHHTSEWSLCLIFWVPFIWCRFFICFLLSRNTKSKWTRFSFHSFRVRLITQWTQFANFKRNSSH